MYWHFSILMVQSLLRMLMRGCAMSRFNYRNLSITAYAVIATLTIGAPALAGAAGIRNPAIIAPLTAIGLVAGGLAAPYVERYKKNLSRKIDHEIDFRDGSLTDHGGLPPLTRYITDCTVLGVHPARLDNAVHERMPSYVSRDIDDELRKRVLRGEFVLLVGDSTAGKSRTAYEAVAASMPDCRLIVPDSRPALQVAIGQIERYDKWVLWLDDLERFLGTDGLTRVLLTRLLNRPGNHAIVATIRATEHAGYTDPVVYTEADQTSREMSRDARSVIEQASLIRIPRKLSRSESQEASTGQWDPRIADALRHSDRYGLAEYLAAGPELLNIWQDAWEPGTHPRGAALVATAIDCRRCGLTRPIGHELITKLHEYYLAAQGGVSLRPEPLQEAWAWAISPRRTTTAFLTASSDPDPSQSSTAYEVFDYLVEMAKITDELIDRIPDHTLRACIEFADSTESDRLGNIAHRTGRYQIAYDAYLHARLLRQEASNLDYSSILNSSSNIALVLHEQGRLTEAEREHRKVFTERREIFGPEDPSTLTSRSNLALVLHDLARLDEAEAEYRSVLAIRTKLLGPNDPSTLTSRHHLARVLHDQGQLEEAETECRAVLAARTDALGTTHPSTLHTRATLARILHDLGRLDEAEAEHVTELRARVEMLTSARPDPTLGFLGQVLQDTGRLEEPEAEQAAELATLNLIPRSGMATTLIGRETFPRIIHAITRLPEAEAIHLAELQAYAQLLGPDHPNTLASKCNHARVLHAMGRFVEAETAHRQVLEARVQVLGTTHPSTLVSRNNLALVLEDLGRFTEAEALHRQKLETCLSILGPVHLNTLTSRASLGAVWYAMGRLSEAAQEHQEVLQARLHTLGPDHPGTLTSRANLATVWYAMGRLSEAAQEHHEVLRLEIQLLGADHPSVQATHDIIAMLSEKGAN
jgi:tetratricopeptide (TPR) repeat protein